MDSLFHRIILLPLLGISLTFRLAAQVRDSSDVLQQSAPKVFIDCSMCDIDYIRTEISFINYVRDRLQADIHILVTQQETGSGGTEHTLTFYGLGQYLGMNDTTRYMSKKDDTEDITRKGLVRVMKTGLLRYAMRTPLADFFQVNYSRPTAAAGVVDKWDYWNLSIKTGGYINGESQYKYYSLFGRVNANRTTEDWKLAFSFYGNYNESRYDFSLDGEDTKSISIRRTQSFTAIVVRSIDSHWSAGLFGGMSSSTYSNIDFSFSVQPGIEFNIYPYSESTHRQLRWGYKIGPIHIRYVDTTIYFKKSELLFEHSLSASLTLKQPWGSTYLALAGFQYLHDLQKHSIEVYANVNVRIIEGLTFDLGAGYTAVHNQLALSKSSLTLEDVYQSRRQLATQYTYYAEFGLSFSFGSMFNNIVNPRFGT